MRGEITTYDPTTGTGAIKGHDGSLYVYTIQNLYAGTEPHVGQTVEFVPEGSTATRIVDLGTAAPFDSSDAYSPGSSPHASAVPATASLFTAPPVYESYDLKTAMLSYVGRMRRQHFGISFLILFAASIVLGLIPFLGQIISLALLWPFAVITIKRLHDMGKSGWLTLVPVIGSFVSTILIILGGAGSLVNAASSGYDTQATAIGTMAMIGIGFLVWLITVFGFLIWIAFTNSQPGTNQYGPNPKGQ